MGFEDNQKIEYFAVIDTETTWENEVMSIGIVIANSDSFESVEQKYYIITPECNYGGMYSYVLNVKNVRVDLKGSRTDVINNLREALNNYNVRYIFAYNASFDYKHLPELQNYMWFDIMKFAAYRQYNSKIPETAECCGTGRLKCNYGVEPIIRMLSGKATYCEVHNAVCDARDELEIMKLLGYPVGEYSCTQINASAKTQARKTRRLSTERPFRTDTKENKPPLTENIIAPENCKYSVGDIINHKAYGQGEIRKVEQINAEILLLTVRYKTIGISLHFLPAEEQDIQCLNE